MSETRDRENLVGALERADREYRRVQADIDDVGEDDVKRVAEAYDDATGLLDRYDGKATGTGTEEFQAFVRFQEEITQLVEDLDEDIPEYDAFETALDRLDKRRVSERDFERARDALAPAGEIAGLLDDRREARRSYHEARRAIARRIDEIEAEIDELERLTELGEADLSAPTERLREPIDAYDDAVRDAFREFRRDAPARAVLELVVATRAFPLVDLHQPPENLLSYVRDADAGEETINTLLEYADYSRSKLQHYVEDPAELKRRIATEQTYLERLDGEPLTVGWPPPSADRLCFELDERIAVCARFADDEVVDLARRVRALPRETDYERLREAAVAEQRLGPAERDRLESGGVERDLQRLRDERERLQSALDEYPRR